MRNLLKFKRQDFPKSINSSTFYSGLLHHIQSYLNVKNSIESKEKLAEFIKRYGMLSNKASGFKNELNEDKEFFEKDKELIDKDKEFICGCKDDNVEMEDIKPDFVKKNQRFSKKSNELNNSKVKFQKDCNLKLLKNQKECNFEQLKESDKKLEIERFKNKRIYFIEEIRQLILIEMKMSEDSERIEMLKKLHAQIHLIQLHLNETEYLFNKVNEFLNANFKLKAEDFVGNAIRGNFNELTKIYPEYLEAIEEFLSNSQNKNSIDFVSNWAEKYKIPDFLIEIFSGKFREFEDDLERFCYSLAFFGDKAKDGFKKTENSHIKMLLRNFDPLKKEGVIGLIYNLTFSLDENLIQNSFEEVFLEIASFDSATAVNFLPFTKNMEFFYNLLISKIDFRNTKIANLINFAVKNGIANDFILEKYALSLQEAEEYNFLCRFLCQNPVKQFNYTFKSLDYFIKEFNSFKFLISEEFLQDPSNMFIFEMADIQNPTFSKLIFLIENKFFDFFKESILEGFTKINDKNCAMKGLGKIFDLEKRGYKTNHKIKKELIAKLDK